MPWRRALVAAAVALIGLAAPGDVLAQASCHAGQAFGDWLHAFRNEAAGQGLSTRALAALDGLTPDPRVLKQDRGQPSLSQSFLDFADRVVTPARISKGRALLVQYAEVFRRIEHDYGVPGPVIVAFWALETDFGAFTGDYASLRALATLAYDCRRPDYFKTELLDALTLIDRGDLRPAEMKGAWAGELGQVQFTPSNYMKYAVDYDGDGRRDLVGSVPDALASTANYLAAIGWRRAEPWIEEVRVGSDVPWAEAARETTHPRSFWAKAGVRRADGGALAADDRATALILLMGRLGPAFLAYPNFNVYWEWNQSSNYSLAAAYLATRLAGAQPMARGTAPAILSAADMLDLQQRLNRIGIKTGAEDGRLGEDVRAGVKQAQMRLNLPPDGYPTAELLRRVRAGELGSGPAEKAGAQ